MNGNEWRSLENFLRLRHGMHVPSKPRSHRTPQVLRHHLDRGTPTKLTTVLRLLVTGEVNRRQDGHTC